MEGFLHRICDKLRKHLQIRTILPDTEGGTRTSDYVLFVAGGDVEEAVRIKKAFSLLNKCRSDDDEIIRKFATPDVWYLYDNLLFRTIILESITKNLNEEEESYAAG